MKYTVSDAAVKRYWKLKESDHYKYNSWNCFAEWTAVENFSKGGAYWSAMKMICKEDRSFLNDVIHEFQMTQCKLDTIANAFAVVNDLQNS